jgi:alkylmercury lyase
MPARADRPSCKSYNLRRDPGFRPLTDFLAGLAARVAALTDDEAAVSRHCFRALLAGHPARLSTLAEATGRDAAGIGRAVDALSGRGHLGIDEASGTVTVARGLSASPTPHRLRLDTRTLHVCCAVDAVGIPAALGIDAVVESRCRQCGAALALTMRAGAVVAAPPGIVIWAADLDPARSLHEHT